MTEDDVEITSRETLFQGFFRLGRYTLRHRRFAGDWTPSFTRELFERGHAAAVLLYDPLQDVLVLLEQFRIGALASGHPPWLIELVAGICDNDESPEITARRETLEEAGYQLTNMEKISTCLVSPGASSETVTLFCARIHARTDDGFYGVLAENEDIRTHIVPVQEALAWLDSDDPRVAGAPVQIALNWLGRHHTALRARWLAERPDGMPLNLNTV